MRQILRPVEFEMAPIGRVDRLGDDRARPRLHRRPVGLADARRPRPRERLVETRARRILDDHALDRALVPVEHRAGQDIAAAHRAGGDRQRLVVEPRILRDPGEIALMIGAVVERQVERQAGEVLVPAVIGGEQHVALAEPVRLDRLGQRPPQDRPRDPVALAELLRRDRLDPGEEGPRLVDLPPSRFLGQVGDLLVKVANPERRRIGRAVAQQPAIMLVEQHPEIVRRRRRQRRGKGQSSGGEQEFEAHGFVSNPPLHLQGRGTACNAVEGPFDSRSPLHHPSGGPLPSKSRGGLEYLRNTATQGLLPTPRRAA